MMLRAPEPADTASEGAISPRVNLPVAIWLAACVVVAILWIVFSEVPGKVFISSWSIVVPGIFLVALFLVLRQFVPHALTRQRLLLMYAMLAASSCLTGYGAIQAMYPAIATQFYNASPSNNWASFNQFVPTWLAPRSPEVLKGLFMGHSAVPWGAWLVPMACWGAIWCAIAFAMLGLSILLSRTWIHQERLTFPIVQLPLELTTERTALFRNRSLWLGFALPCIAESLLALQYYIPTVPAVQMKHVDYSPLFTTPPWNALAPFYFGFTPFIVGFAYLAPTDISFSIFFFTVLDRLVQVGTVAMGGDAASVGAYLKQAPFSQQQTIGAFCAFGILPLVRAFPRMAADLKDPRNRLERAGLLLLALSSLFLVIILWAAGVSALIGVVVVALFLMFGTALARIRAESGAVWAFGPYGGLVGNLINVAGTGSFTTPQIANLSTLQWTSADMRFLPMPFHLESLKIADSSRIPRRTMVLALAIATILGVATGMAAVLWLEYQLGVASGKVYGGVSYWMQLVTSRSTYWTSNHTQPDYVGLPWIAFGFAVTWILAALRQSFVWWPFHPIGYVLAHTGTGLSFWGHYFIAWMLKTLVLRYGGNDLYRRSIPFVVGVILGDILTQTIWSAGAVLLGVPVYQFIS